MSIDEDISGEEAYRRVDRALTQRRINFTRHGLKYEIPNFIICYDQVVAIAKEALKGTTFYSQELPYREMRPEFEPEHMLVLHRDDRQ